MPKVVEVKLNNISDIQAFCQKACQSNYDVTVTRGIYAVDAKSILGLFSIDMSQGVTVVTEDKEFTDWVANFIAK